MTPAAEVPLWVVGAGGLLGGAVARAARERGIPVLTARVPWSDPDAAVAALTATAASLPTTGWRLAWCAGSGVVSSTTDHLDAEVGTLHRFLTGWRPQADANRCGVFVASSAGGVYAGSASPPFTENTEPVPISPYGAAKLRVEREFEQFAEARAVPLLVGRIANLYGPGQDLGKGQGLVSLLCEAHLRHRPLSIYVPLDTRRDYLYVDDAAAMVLDGLDLLAERPGRRVRILASGRPATVAELLGELRRVSRRRPPMILGSSPVAGMQAADLRFRSVVWPELDRQVRTPLAVGIAACLAAVDASLRCPQEGP
ncbi:MAG: NAD-dependent epimerase/dehydratase family protein [Nocardioidaceae bacterium]|nr:NAD-dependent epimerase/dehydratase family protein [Nocardioidaceae bacterium]